MSKSPDKKDCELNLSTKSKIVLEERYLRKNEHGEIVEAPACRFELCGILL